MTNTLVIETVTAPAHDGLARDELALLAPVYPLPRLELVSGRGAWVASVDGRTYLDFVSGIAVNAFGHAPRGLGRVVATQMSRLGHVSNMFTTQPARALARELTSATGFDRAFFCNSGSEAMDAAIKFARVYARARGRVGRDVLAFRNGFHGRTGFALSATWNPSYREPFEPLVPGVRFADLDDVDAFVRALDEDVCAVVVEPVQGEGGAIPASRAFLETLRTRCTDTGALLVFDEIQCGMGRCGRLLAAEHYDVRADITVLGKALGAGMPLAAVLMTSAVAASLAPGMHGSTFGGNPVAATAGRWALERIRAPRFLSRVRRRAAELESGLVSLVANHPASLARERGLGLLRAVELHAEARFTAPELVAAARREGLLVVRGGERAIRFLPPLNVTVAEIGEAVRRFDRALTSLEQESPS